MTQTLEGPPSAVDAERQVLAAVLYDPRVLDELSLTTVEFSKPAHRAIWQATNALAERGEPVEHTAVIGQLQRAGELNEPVRAALLEITEVPSTSSGPYYALEVAEAATNRRLHDTGTFLHQLSMSTVEDKATAAAERLDAVFDLCHTVTARPAGDLTVEAMDRYEQSSPSGVRTGFLDLDMMLNPMSPGQLIVVAARPGIGKSSLLLGIAMRQAQIKRAVTLFSLEMGDDDLADRMLASSGPVDLGALRRRELTDSDFARLVGATAHLAELPLTVDTSENLSLADFRASCRRQQRTGLDLAIVDYLQLMNVPRGESRQVEVAGLSRGFKLAAKSLGIPIIVAAQLNRAGEQRADKTPRLTDLRESGAIEQDADVVILLHVDENKPGVLEAHIAKQRNGPRGVVELGWQGQFSRVVDLEPGWRR
jgi:replicative DNA helicase